MKEIDDARFKVIVQQRDRRRQRGLEVRGPLELFVVTTLEFFQEIERSKKTDEGRKADYLAHVEMHVNAPLRAIGERYGNRVPQVDLTAGALTYLSASKHELAMD
jgi:hypothetical protein